MGAKSSFNLRRLVLQDTGIDVFGVMQAARIGILKTLIELDITGNKLDKAAAQVRHSLASPATDHRSFSTSRFFALHTHPRVLRPSPSRSRSPSRACRASPAPTASSAARRSR